MDLNKYRVDFDYCVEIPFFTGMGGSISRSSGYEIVYAGSAEGAKGIAEERARGSLRKQNTKIIFLDIKEAVLID